MKIIPVPTWPLCSYIHTMCRMHAIIGAATWQPRLACLTNRVSRIDLSFERPRGLSGMIEEESLA